LEFEEVDGWGGYFFVFAENGGIFTKYPKFLVVFGVNLVFE